MNCDLYLMIANFIAEVEKLLVCATNAFVAISNSFPIPSSL